LRYSGRQLCFKSVGTFLATRYSKEFMISVLKSLAVFGFFFSFKDGWMSADTAFTD
jgi:hypothetical protein